MEVSILDKTLVMNEIDSIITDYCDGCFLKSALKEDKGRAGAHQFCITDCTVGEQLKFLGGEMNKLTK